MTFELKQTKNKSGAINKSIYISQTLIDKIQQIAKDNDTSFNNVVISMIEHCLKEDNE